MIFSYIFYMCKFKCLAEMSTLQSLHSFLSDLFYADCWLHWKFRHCRKVTPRRQGGKASPDMPVSVFFPKHALINQMWSNTSTEHVVPLSVSKGRSLSSSVMNQSREFWATLLGAPLTGTLSESFVFGQFRCQVLQLPLQSRDNLVEFVLDGNALVFWCSWGRISSVSFALSWRGIYKIREVW